MSTSYRAERRADQAAARQQEREDRRLFLEAQLKAKEIEAEQRRLDKAEEAEIERRAVAEKRRLQRDEQRQRDAKKAAAKLAATAKRTKRVRWLKENPATLFVAFVMIASIVPAVISQIGALSGASVNVALAALLAAMLEGGAWAVTFMGKQAEDAGRETRKYRIAGWLMSGAAGSVNLWHGLEQYKAHPWVAFVLGASSLFAFFIWDMKTHGSDGKTRAEKRDAKARAKHLAKRRRHHKGIAKEADQLQSALPFGAITDEEAFAAAWRIRKGAEPGLSAELYAAATNSRVQLGAAFELGEHVRPELLRNGIMAAVLSPLPNTLPTLGAVSPLPALTKGSEGSTSQAGIGLYAPRSADEKGAGEKAPEPVAKRSDAELELILPDALAAAAELVAEGKQISAAQLSKRLQIRREDAMRLRDMVVTDRKDQYRTAAASDGTARKSITARITK
ncbi:hypothetical protein ACFVW9_15155 [Streptomyces sp. NPDC058217]|uniref:hypothetical protein n=1 Tax=Streptomyces sp. NPDC058217 TaxID=3346384 RepID=UPI0036E24FC0